MQWWNHFWRGSAEELEEPIRRVRLAMPGWSEGSQAERMRTWRDIDGDVLTLAISSEPFRHADGADETRVRRWCRGFARSNGGGLIEACAVNGGITLIFKQLKMPAYVYSGMLITHVREAWLMWTIIAPERGTTGVREAVVTATLLNEGKLKPEEYEQRWGQDPYDPAFRGAVDRSLLRFISDDERYDQQFPEHPLSKVRQTLATLSKYVEYDS
jgi:hypothetical protein